MKIRPCHMLGSTVVSLLAAILACLLSVGGYAGEGGLRLEWRGVLGNSGEGGDSLAKGSLGRLGRDGALGVVLDRMGTLWACGGRGIINRYALDGRMLGSYSMPPRFHRADRISIAGDKLVIQLSQKLYVLDINAPDGSAVENTNIASERISLGSHAGKIVTINEKRELLWFDPQNMSLEEIAVFSEEADGGEPVLDKNGGLLVLGNKGIYRHVTDGAKEAANRSTFENLRKSVRPNLQYAGGNWYAHTWHGTIFRYDDSFTADPGVVYGGASGSFIGKLDTNAEYEFGQGIVEIGENLFATSGFNACIMIMEWNPQAGKMFALRRIGPFVNGGQGIAFDGRSIWVRHGAWDWNDSPRSPLRFGVGLVPDGQIVVRADLGISGPALLYGSRPAWARGALSSEVENFSEHKVNTVNMRRGNIGTALYIEGTERRALVIDRKGELLEYELTNATWSPKRNLGVVAIAPTVEVKDWTTLAYFRDRLYAGCDGVVREFQKDGEGWKESGFFGSWGEGETQRFGEEIYFCLDGDELWVSDTQRHRVVLINLPERRYLGEIGRIGEAGAGSGEFNEPEAISANGGKAALIDRGNFRVVKLEKAGF